MRNLAVCFLFLFISAGAVANDSLTVSSPSGKINVKVWLDGIIKYRIYNKDIPLLLPSGIDMQFLGQGSLTLGSHIKSSSVKTVSAEITSPVPEKRKIIADHYTLLTIGFSRPFKIEFRVYDDGVAYRFLISFKDSVTVKNETADFCFPANPGVYYPGVQKREDLDIFHTSFEELYQFKPLTDITSKEMAFSPVLIAPEEGAKTAITESDLEDYPGMFLGWHRQLRIKRIVCSISIG